MEKAHKCPESPKAIKKVECSWKFSKHNTNVPAINAPQLYQKDNSDGHSSNVYTDDRFFYEEIHFLTRELGHKQKNYRQFIKDHKLHGQKLKRSLSRLTQQLKKKVEIT